MKFFKFILVLAAALACAYGVYFMLGRMAGEKKSKPKGTPEINIMKVPSESFENRIEALGTAQAQESVVITASITETVDQILFNEGQEVKKGDILVKLEQAEELANLQQAELSMKEEERLYQIAETLNEKKAISKTEYEKQLYSRNAAIARLDAAKNRVARRNITAPFAGQTGIRQVSPGALVTPGTPITTLDDLSVIRLFFTVPESFLASLKKGQDVEATASAYPEKTFKGKVSIIDSRIDVTTRAVTIIAEFQNADRKIRPGMLMKIELISGEHKSPSIPEKALLSYGQRHFVFVLKNDSTVERRQIELGIRTFGRVEALKGISAGESIVSDGINKISDGSKVSVKSGAAAK